MGNKTNIEWTDATWNFLRGCTRVSRGCVNCYAERIAARFSGPGMPYEGLAGYRNSQPRWTGEIRFDEKTLLAALKWRKPRRVFVNSMSDLFHEKVEDKWLDQAFAVMALTPHITYQILTKRPERMLEWFSERWQAAPAQQIGRFHLPAETVGEDRRCQVSRAASDLIDDHKLINFDSEDIWTEKGELKLLQFAWPLPSVWLGVSIEDQKTADERIPYLLQTPAAVRFLSIEPLLGPVDLEHEWGAYQDGNDSPLRKKWINGIHLVIVGGESGPGARRMQPEWVRTIRDQCKAAGVPFFFKQGSQANWPKFKDFDAFPKEFQIREFPK